MQRPANIGWLSNEQSRCVYGSQAVSSSALTFSSPGLGKELWGSGYSFQISDAQTLLRFSGIHVEKKTDKKTVLLGGFCMTLGLNARHTDLE